MTLKWLLKQSRDAVISYCYKLNNKIQRAKKSRGTTIKVDIKNGLTDNKSLRKYDIFYG